VRLDGIPVVPHHLEPFSCLIVANGIIFAPAAPQNLRELSPRLADSTVSPAGSTRSRCVPGVIREGTQAAYWRCRSGFVARQPAIRDRGGVDHCDSGAPDQSPISRTSCGLRAGDPRSSSMIPISLNGMGPARVRLCRAASAPFGVDREFSASALGTGFVGDHSAVCHPGRRGIHLFP